jgi:endonuclease/exonuclease/phosphatase family metal-dependent hydrolase
MPESMKAMRRVRVISWNIHKCVGGTDRRYDPKRVISVLRQYDADLLLLQEVAQHIPRLGGHDQVQLLTDALEMHSAFHAEHCFRRGHYGNLILSRFPLFDVSHVDLKVGWRKQRGMLQAHTRVPIGQHTRTMVLHNLHLGLAGSERATQLARFIASHPFKRIHQSTPLIVGGDLNDVWGSLGPRFLEPEGFGRAGRLKNTFPSALPIRPLDGIFYRGSLSVYRADLAASAVAKQASDHLPLIADFEVHLPQDS